MTHEQKQESAEFRTRAEQIVTIMCEAQYSDIIREKGLEELFDTILAEAEARGAAEQRRKDAEGIEEAKDEGANYVLTSLALLFGRDGFEIRDGSETWEGDVNATLEGILRTNGLINEEGDVLDVPVLEARVKELEAEKRANEVAAFERGFQGGRRDRYKQYERETAEAVAAERERCAKVCEQRRETFGNPAYAGGPIGAFSEMFACKACAAAIREGGEHG